MSCQNQESELAFFIRPEKNWRILSDFNEIHVFYPPLIIFTYFMRLILEEYIFLIRKYTVLGKCWLGHFSVQFSECTPKSRVSRRRTSILGGTRNCMEKWSSQQVPRKGIFSDQNYIFSHVDRVFFGSIWTNSNIRSPKVLHIIV